MAKKKKEVVPEFPKVIETFRKMGDYNMFSMTQSEPSCFNGIVNFRKYRITVEQIVEPWETLNERLETLWLQSDNFHHREPLRNAAKSIGYEFKGEFGSQRPKKS